MSDTFPDIQRIEAMTPKTVRVRDNAVSLYQGDSRWDSTSWEQRDLGLRVLTEIVGKECEVLSAEQTRDSAWYNIKITPSITVEGLDGKPQQIGMAVVPYDYITVLNMGFCRAN
jgi:hypothetical protein